MKKIGLIGLGILGLFLSLSSFASSFNEELQLVYELSNQETPLLNNKAEKPASSPRLTLITIGLGENYLTVTDDGRKTIYDFSKRRIYHLNHSQMIYEDRSLFFEAAARKNGLDDRLARDETAGKTGNSMGLFDLFELETFYSLESGKKSQKVPEKSVNGVLKYTAGGETIVETAFSKTRLTDSQQKIWAKYLLYECHIHPVIRRGLSNRPYLPQLLSYHYQDLTQRQVRMKLMEVKKTAVRSNEIPPDYGLSVDLNDELSGIMHEVAAGQSKIPRLGKEDFRTATRNAYERRNYLEALLALLEYYFQDGEQLPDEMVKLEGRTRSDPRMKLFMENLGVPGETAEKFIQSLDAIDRNQLTRSLYIDYMKARALFRLKEYDQAIKVFLEVLRVNPYMAGAYRDLGFVFIETRREAIAWKCWDLARQLAPEHFFLDAVFGYEAKLLEEYAEYF